MKIPLAVSIKLIPTANIIGSDIIAATGMPLAQRVAEIASNATSEAVSKPNSNRNPSG